MQKFRSYSSILVKQKGDFQKIINLYFKKIELIRKKKNSLGLVIFQRQEENVQHGCPESSQTRVVNQVESGNQQPWFGGTGENFARFRVVNYVSHCFPTMPFFRFDGSSTQNRWFWIRHGVVSPLEVASEADNSHFSNNLPIFQPLHSTTGSQQQAVAQKSWASWEKSFSSRRPNGLTKIRQILQNTMTKKPAKLSRQNTLSLLLLISVQLGPTNTIREHLVTFWN